MTKEKDYLIPFNLSLALKGAPIVNRAGEQLSIIQVNVLSVEPNKVVVQGYKLKYKVSYDGRFADEDHERDLFMKLTKREERTNVIVDFLQFLFDTEQSLYQDKKGLAEKFLDSYKY